MSAEDDLNASPDENRAMAAAIIPVLRDMQMSFMGLALDLGKWVMTSLLAINGAGVLAVWPSDLPIAFKIGSCVVFVLGILAAMLSGYVGLHYLSRVGDPLGEMIGYWISVQADGERVAECEDFDKLANLKGTGPSTFFGWLAAGLFVVGAVIAGWGGYISLDQQPHEIQEGAIAPHGAPYTSPT